MKPNYSTFRSLFILSTILFISLNSEAQRSLKGKEIGVDIRHFNQSGNFSLLVRKPTSDSMVLKRRNYSFSFSSSSDHPDYTGMTNAEIPDEFMRRSNSSGMIDFTWGREHYQALEQLNAKDLYFYHVLLKSVRLTQSNNLSLSNTVNGNGELVSISRSANTSAGLGFGVSLAGGLKYHFTRRLCIGVESAVSAGINLQVTENKNSMFTIFTLNTTESGKVSTASTASYFRPQLINAIWLSYKF